MNILFIQVRCTLPALAASTVDVTVTSNGVTYDAIPLTFSDAATPAVVSVSPTGETLINILSYHIF